MPTSPGRKSSQNSDPLGPGVDRGRVLRRSARPVLQVRSAIYYEAIGGETSARKKEDRQLTALIVEVYRSFRSIYRAPRVHAELRLGLGPRVGRKRLARLMS